MSRSLPGLGEQVCDTPGVFLKDISPSTTEIVETPSDDLHFIATYADMLGNKVALSRQKEFFTARRCAEDAMYALTGRRENVGRGVWREPVWPIDLVGSITHCVGYRSAIVARSSDVLHLGIDAEPNLHIPTHSRRSVLGYEEWLYAEMLHIRWPTVCWDRLMFCAKEAALKAWGPRPTDLSFTDLCVTIELDSQNLTIKSRWDDRIIRGRFAHSATHLGVIVS